MKDKLNFASKLQLRADLPYFIVWPKWLPNRVVIILRSHSKTQLFRRWWYSSRGAVVSLEETQYVFINVSRLHPASLLLNLCLFGLAPVTENLL